VQRLLAGVLETGQFTRLGGSEPLTLRARVLTAAQPGVEQRAGGETLRRDLLAHLNVLIVRVPPLRDYAEDVPDLLRHHVDRLVDTDALTASASRPRTGCATTPGPTTCASCATWCIGC
jgi:DNA-binding NtrC family response regulator